MANIRALCSPYGVTNASCFNDLEKSGGRKTFAELCRALFIRPHFLDHGRPVIGFSDRVSPNQDYTLYSKPKVSGQVNSTRQRFFGNIHFADNASDFAQQGFVVLAPLRDTPADFCNGDETIKEGIRVANRAANCLKFLLNV